jgi:hypothetical protein
MEFAEHVARQWAEACGFIHELMDLSCRARFGQLPFSKADREQGETLLAVPPQTVLRNRIEAFTVG